MRYFKAHIQDVPFFIGTQSPRVEKDFTGHLIQYFTNMSVSQNHLDDLGKNILILGSRLLHFYCFPGDCKAPYHLRSIHRLLTFYFLQVLHTVAGRSLSISSGRQLEITQSNIWKLLSDGYLQSPQMCMVYIDCYVCSIGLRSTHIILAMIKQIEKY